jgi:RND family efflux transporter MFP subunit
MTRFCATLLCVLAFAFPVNAGPGHDHGEEAKPALVAQSPRLESTGTELELVAVADGHKLTIYLDRVATNEPVDGANIEISGDGIQPVAAKASSEGTYEIEANWLDEPGTKALVFVVTVGGTADLLSGVLDIPTPAKAEAPAMPNWNELLAMPALWIVGAVAALIGFVLAFAFRPSRAHLGELAGDETRSKPKLARGAAHVKDAAELILLAAFLGTILMTTSAIAHEGHDHGGGSAPVAGNAPRKLPEGDVFVPKPTQRLLHVRTAVAKTDEASESSELIGKVIPDPSSAGQVQAPMDGEIELAERGISYVGQRVTAGEVLAMLAPSMPVYERGTLAQVTADVEGKLRIAEQKLARLTRISGDYIPQREIDDTKTEIESLRQQKRVLEPKNVERMELKAPVSGIISVANVRAGQVVSARDTLFEIVDPAKLWVEAIGADRHGEGEIASAHAIDTQGHSFKLTYIGRAPALRQQSLPLLFGLDETHGNLSIGSTVRVVAARKSAVRGIVLPEAAVVRGSNGMPQVWSKVSAERFTPVPVRTTSLDGSRVLVLSGLPEGSRVVVEGAELINQIR